MPFSTAQVRWVMRGAKKVGVKAQRILRPKPSQYARDVRKSKGMYNELRSFGVPLEFREPVKKTIGQRIQRAARSPEAFIGSAGAITGLARGYEQNTPRAGESQRQKVKRRIRIGATGVAGGIIGVTGLKVSKQLTRRMLPTVNL
jgi:hypothetical protein